MAELPKDEPSVGSAFFGKSAKVTKRKEMNSRVVSQKYVEEVLALPGRPRVSEELHCGNCGAGMKNLRQHGARLL